MILVAGMSPVWQQLLLLDQLDPGSVNRAERSLWYASGKVLNVAVALRQLHVDCRCLTVVGGSTGAAIEDDIALSEYAGFRWVHVDQPTRVCVTVVEQTSGRVTELVPPTPPVNADTLVKFREAFADECATASTLVWTGSLPRDLSPAYVRSLLDGVSESTRLILDIRGADLAECLSRRPYIVKPNRTELEATFGMPLRDEASLRAAMAELRQRGAENVIVTDGAEAVWVDGPEGTHRLETLSVPVINPIGCGDAFTAGLAMALDRGDPLLGAVEWGMATAAAKVGVFMVKELEQDAVLHLHAGRTKPPAE